MESRYFKELPIKQSDGFVSYARLYEVEKPIVTIVAFTGMADHIGRFHDFAVKMQKNNFQVLMHDYRSHGKSIETDKKAGQFRWDNGFNLLINDSLNILENAIINDHTIVYFGHSFGSAIARALCFKKEPAALILSGCPYNDPLTERFGNKFLNTLSNFFGNERILPLLLKMSYGKFNKSFKPNRTPFDWISSVNENVDKYIQDPLAGYDCSIGFYKTMMDGFNLLWKKRDIEVRFSFPCLLMGGANDSVTNLSKSLKNIQKQYLMNGGRSVVIKEYADNRHECLNDKASSQMILHITHWIDSNID